MLEGLKALSVERALPRQHVVGVPPETDISRALGRLYAFIGQGSLLSAVEKEVALLRWHTICLHMAVDFNRLCQALFGDYNILQRIIRGPKFPAFEVRSWVSSTRARRGLLHAFSIYSILQTLPTSHLQRLHVPIATFSAGIIYCAFLLGGVSSTYLPRIENWDSVVLIDLDMHSETGNDDLDRDVRRFLSGTLNQPERNTNLLYDISFFSRTLKTLDQLWGVSKDMQEILDELSSHCL